MDCDVIEEISHNEEREEVPTDVCDCCDWLMPLGKLQDIGNYISCKDKRRCGEQFHAPCPIQFPEAQGEEG